MRAVTAPMRSTACMTVPWVWLRTKLAEWAFKNMNVYHLAHRIKRQMLDTNVIIMTGRYKDDCLEMMATQWVDGWLFKPFGWNKCAT